MMVLIVIRFLFRLGLTYLVSLCTCIDIHVKRLPYSSGSSWLFVTPFGMRRIVNWIKHQYGDVAIYVTENGVSDRTGDLQDYHRVNFYRMYINELMKGELSSLQFLKCIILWFVELLKISNY